MPRDTIKKMGIKQIDGAQVVKDIGVKAENVEQIVASYEVTPASAPHAIGDLIYFNDILYKVTQAIAINDALVVDTNISADTGVPAYTQVHINGLPGGGGGGGSTITVVDNLDSTSTTDALSANMGHELSGYINLLENAFEGLTPSVFSRNKSERKSDSGLTITAAHPHDKGELFIIVLSEFKARIAKAIDDIAVGDSIVLEDTEGQNAEYVNLQDFVSDHDETLYKLIFPPKDPNTMESIASEESTASFSHLKGTTFWVNYNVDGLVMQIICVARENIYVGDALESKTEIIAAPPQHFEFGDWTNYLSDTVGGLLIAGEGDEEDFSATDLLGKNLIKKKEYYLYNPAKYFHTEGSLLLINNKIYKATTDIRPEDTLNENINVIPVTNLASTNNLFNFLYPTNEIRDEDAISDNLLLKWESERLPGKDMGDLVYTWSALDKNSDDYSEPEVGDEIFDSNGKTINNATISAVDLDNNQITVTFTNLGTSEEKIFTREPSTSTTIGEIPIYVFSHRHPKNEYFWVNDAFNGKTILCQSLKEGLQGFAIEHIDYEIVSLSDIIAINAISGVNDIQDKTTLFKPNGYIEEVFEPNSEDPIVKTTIFESDGDITEIYANVPTDKGSLCVVKKVTLFDDDEITEQTSMIFTKEITFVDINEPSNIQVYYNDYYLSSASFDTPTYGKVTILQSQEDETYDFYIDGVKVTKTITPSDTQIILS